MTGSVQGELTIGALAKRTGCSVPTIRYYEEIGLIPRARRRASGHRVFDASLKDLLAFIRRCRDFGFPVEQVRELVALSQSEERDCSETLHIAQEQLRAVRAQMTELRRRERSLLRFAGVCSERCAGGPAARCTIVQDMAQPRGTGCCG